MCSLEHIGNSYVIVSERVCEEKKDPICMLGTECTVHAFVGLRT